MNYELILLLTGVMLFCYWFNYVMGGPLSDDDRDVNVKAILFSFPKYLAVKRLKKKRVYRDILHQYIQEQEMTRDEVRKEQLRTDHLRGMYISGREFFTWEKSLLCPICLHWWLTVLVAVVLLSFDLLNARADFFIGAFTYLVNHLLIRKLS